MVTRPVIDPAAVSSSEPIPHSDVDPTPGPPLPSVTCHAEPTSCRQRTEYVWPTERKEYVLMYLRYVVHLYC
jgi:hypothetical protein